MPEVAQEGFDFGARDFGLFFEEHDGIPDVSPVQSAERQCGGEGDGAGAVGTGAVFEDFDVVGAKPVNELLDVHRQSRKHYTPTDYD